MTAPGRMWGQFAGPTSAGGASWASGGNPWASLAGSGGPNPTSPQNGTPYGLYWGGKGATQGFEQGLSRDIQGRNQRSQRITGLYDNALADPTGTANMFGDFFKQAAAGYADPALRDFQASIKDVAGGVARRFGGNASTEEQRQVQGASDVFSRNLTDALARLAPEQANLGLAYTGQLGQAQSGASGQEDILKELLLSALGQTKGGTGIDWGKILGSSIGALIQAKSGGAAPAPAGG